MLKRFVTWCLGYVCVIIYGYFPERFLNLCNARKIKLWNVGRTEKGYILSMSVKDYKKLRPIVRKTKTRPWILKKRGLPFVLKRLRPRVGLWAGALLFAALIYGYSQFIWSVEISGQYSHTSVELKKYLKSLEVYPGTRKALLDCTGIEESLRKEYKDIGWVSAEIRGSKMLIRIRETNLAKEKKKEGAPAHLIAPASGEIASVIVRKGTLTVRKGDKVEAGDILINGVVDIVGDNELLLRKEAVEADGDIYLNTWISYHQEYPLKYKRKEYTGKIKKKYTIQCLGYEISFDNPLKSLENWTQYDIIGERSILYSPVELVTTEYREYRKKDAVYSEKEITQMAKDWFTVYLKELEEKKIKVLDNQVKLTVTADKCIAAGSLYVSEPVQTYRKITDNEWRNIETDEYSRNNN
ncbi:MAG: sporulation protein YqfD [Acetivibrio ethanolgignens]